MTRLDKKKIFKEHDIPVSKGIFGLVDSVMLKIYRISEEELDKICQVANDDELELFTKENRTINESKKLLIFLKDKIYK
jgi:hypothetical protein